MKVYIDADGCPVVNQTIKICREFGVGCYILCDTSHVFERDGAETITVSKGADSADFTLVNLLAPGDVAVTQDYGLAAMCLARGCIAVNQDGNIYDDNNILSLLNQRHTAKKIRMAGGRMHGPAKRKKEQDENFCSSLRQILSQRKKGM